MPKSHILWVSFDFPPRQSSAVFRTIKIYKYMDKDAFEVDFLTQSPNPRYEKAVMDETLMEGLSPAPRVHKVANWVPHDWIFGLAQAQKRRAKPSVAAGAGSPEDLSRSEPGPHRRPGLAKRIYGELAMIAYFPDQYFMWGRRSALEARRLHRERKYDLVYTTSYPESCHLAGLALKSLGVPWVADYRYGGPLWIRKLLGYRKSSGREAREFRFQKRVLDRADRVVTQSDSIRADFCRVFGLDPGKVKTIPSGYDEMDFVSPPAAPPFPKDAGEIHMIHAGAAYLGSDERARMVARINHIADGLNREGRRLTLHALGDDLFGEAFRRNELRFGYRFHGVVPHHELPSYLGAADWYLLSTLTSAAESGAISGYLPSKMWEYMRGGRPVVLFGPRDEVWSIINDAGVGVYMGALENGNQVSARRLLDAARELVPVRSRIAGHSWESRTRAMQTVFTEVLRKTERRRGA